MLDERVFPMLGILKVAALLEQAGHTVSVLDFSAPAVLTTIPEADVYGITATTPQMPAAATIAQRISERWDGARIILGGPHVTLTNTAAKAEARAGLFGRARAAMLALRQRFDVLVCGDGEQAVFAAMRPDAPKVIDADDVASSLFLTKAALADAPLPARHLIDLSSYRYEIDGHRATSLIGQLGCPFACGFCGGRKSPSFRRVRTRPPQAIVAEMAHLSETYGYTGFMFLDDELNVSPAFPELLKGITDAQKRLGVSWRLRGLVKSELLTEPMAAQMRDAGFRQILSGFESGDDRILANMSKRSTVRQNTQAVDIARRNGLEVKALMSIGHPGESFDSVIATRNWLLEIQPDAFDVTIITVYPGTPYHDDAVETEQGWTYTAKSGDRLHAQSIDQFTDQPFYKGIPRNYKSFVQTDYLSADDLVSLRDVVESDVRRQLKIPYPSTPAEVQYEHSMGAR